MADVWAGAGCAANPAAIRLPRRRPYRHAQSPPARQHGRRPRPRPYNLCLRWGSNGERRRQTHPPADKFFSVKGDLMPYIETHALALWGPGMVRGAAAGITTYLVGG